MIITSFEEQIDKDTYYNQQGKGEFFNRIPKQRGYGVLSTVAKRFAFPALKNFYSSVAKPFVKGVFNEAKSAVTDTIKIVPSKNSKIYQQEFKEIL